MMKLALDEEEQAKAEVWYSRHNRRRGCDKGQEHILVEFRATGIGTYVKVSCPHCGSSCDVTNYSSW